MKINTSQNTPFLLVELLENFSKQEIIGLQQIITCDYFNTDKRVIKLLEVLIKKVIRKSKSNLQIQCILFSQVFDNAFNNTVLTKKQKSLLSAKMSVLTKLTKRFLAIEKLEGSNMNKADLLLNALLDKKQFRFFEKQLKEEYRVLSENTDENYHDHLVKIEQVKLDYLHLSGKWKKKDNLFELIKQLDIAYLMRKLDYVITTLSFSEYKPSYKHDLSIIKLIQSEYFNQYQINKIPIVNIKIAVLNLMHYKTQDDYDKLLILLKKYEPKIDKKELRSFYSVALNFCTLQSKKGYLEYMKHHISIYKILDEKGLFDLDSVTLTNDVRNIVLIGCRLKEFAWIEKIIKKYIPMVNQKFRNSIYNYHLGYVTFNKGDFMQSIDYLSKVDNFSFRYDLTKRVMLIKAYFELDQRYLNHLVQLFRSFESFIANHKMINAKDKTGYKNFIRVAINLYRLKHNVGIIKISTLKTLIDKASYIFNKKWLLEKIEELEGVNKVKSIRSN